MLKRKYIIFYVILSMILLITSCKPTPERLIVQNKNNNKLVEKINAPDIFESQVSFPEYCNESVQSDNGYLRVTVDSAVVIPLANAYPVISVEPMEITQEMADSIISSLIGDSVMYEKNYALTTDEITAKIQETYHYINGELSDYETTDPDYYERKYNSAIEWIQYLTDLLPSSSNEKKEHSREFQSMNSELQAEDAEATREYLQGKGYSEDEIEEMMENYNSQISKQQFICGVVDLGKARMASVEINKYSAKQQQILFYNTESGGTTGTDFFLHQDASAEIKITYEKALEIAKDLISKLGLEHMEVYEVGVAPNYDANEIESGYMYKFIFTRVLNKVPVTYVSDSAYNTYNSSVYFREPWHDEKVEISIDETGIIGFKWINPVQINDVINSNVEILPFEDIKSIFFNQILINNAYQDEGNTEHLEINIEKITLGLAKIARKDTDGYMYVPSWDFMGTITKKFKDDMGEYIDDRYGVSFMTINAIDGSIIDRSLSY